MLWVVVSKCRIRSATGCGWAEVFVWEIIDVCDVSGVIRFGFVHQTYLVKHENIGMTVMTLKISATPQPSYIPALNHQR